MKLVRSFAFAAALVVPALSQFGANAQISSDMATGEVRKVDKETNKITIKHGEIKNLEMPPMTMVFTVTTPTVLDKIKAGDKIKFKAIQQDGKFMVTEILTAP